MIMKDFVFHLPTEIVFGKGVESRVGDMTAAYGKKAMILFGSDRIKKNGLLDRIVLNLQEAGVESVLFGGITENPLVSTAEEAVALAKKEHIEVLLAVGGGSVIDTAKAVSIGALSECPVWDFYNGTRSPEQTLPTGVILTMAATASEANCTSVLSNERTHEKRMMGHPLTYPKFALMNPELTYTVPAGQTAIGSIDILAHAFERYFDLEEKGTLRSRLCEAVMKTVITELPNAIDEPEDYDARSQLMWAATMAHNDMLGAGGVFACHEMSHVVTEVYGLAHGAALAILMPAWCKYMLVRRPDVFAEFARNVWDVPETVSDMQAAQDGIQRFQQFISLMGLPLSFKDAGIRNPDSSYLAKCVMEGRASIGDTFDPIDLSGVIAIFEICKG